MSRVLFSESHDGRWFRREWVEQCDEKVFLGDRCQGVKGHKGVHWHYKLDGTMAWDDNDDDPQEDGCSGSTPPGHKKYISPVEMTEHHYRSHFTDSEVTDPEEIARLKRNDTTVDEAVTRPVSPERAAELWLLKDE
jgi:hypothetical protein